MSKKSLRFHPDRFKRDRTTSFFSTEHTKGTETAERIANQRPKKPPSGPLEGQLDLWPGYLPHRIERG
jgi:hypothetical protein